MNRKELIDKIAKDAQLSKVQANAALKSFTEAVTATLKKRDRVSLVGFGTFSLSACAARNGRNPQTGEIFKVAARKVPKFKAAKEFVAKIGNN